MPDNKKEDKPGGLRKDDKTGDSSKNEKWMRSKDKPLEAGQSTLDGKLQKKVTFVDTDKEFKNKIMDEVRKIRQEAVNIEKIKVEVKAREVELIDRLEKLEKRMQDIEDREKEREAKWRAELSAKLDSSSREGDTSRDSPHGSRWSVAESSVAASVRSGASGVSCASRFSFTDRDVVKMKKMLADKEKKENQDVIVIRGAVLDENKEEVNVTVEKLLRERLGVPAEVKNAWVRGKVVVARLMNVEDKEKVMRNKSKLAGSTIYIESFRNFDERKRQDEISAWVREQKGKGVQ